MKKKRDLKDKNDRDMREEYRIDYSKSRPNRFAKIAYEEPLVVTVDTDVAKVFTRF